MPAVGFLLGTLQHFHHQTLASAEASYPIVKPAAKVSVIIPAYNEEAFIEQALLSVLDQNIVRGYPDLFEVIVVDNESTDSTVEIAQKYAKVYTAPRGKLNAKNLGAEVAEGEILLFMDADATATSNCFNLLLRHFNDPGVVAVGGVIHSPDVDIFYRIAQTQINMANSILCNELNAGLSAIRKEAYFAVGGHIIDGVDQFSRHSIREEEERAFLWRLKDVGFVVIDAEATIWVYHRMLKCAKCTEESSDPICTYCTEAEAKQRF